MVTREYSGAGHTRTVRMVAPRASWIADRVASVPELTMRTISQLGTRRVMVSAIVTSSGFGVPNDRPSRAVSITASSTFGWLWPTIIGPHDPT